MWVRQGSDFNLGAQSQSLPLHQLQQVSALASLLGRLPKVPEIKLIRRTLPHLPCPLCVPAPLLFSLFVYQFMIPQGVF